LAFDGEYVGHCVEAIIRGCSDDALLKAMRMAQAAASNPGRHQRKQMMGESLLRV
jgi:hypothetical protein